MRQSRKCASSRRSMAYPTEVLEELLLVGEAWRRALFDETTSVLHRSNYRLLTSRGDPLIEERAVGGVVVWHRGVSVADCAGGGSALARLESRVAIEILFRRL